MFVWKSIGITDQDRNQWTGWYFENLSVRLFFFFRTVRREKFKTILFFAPDERSITERKYIPMISGDKIRRV